MINKFAWIALIFSQLILAQNTNVSGRQSESGKTTTPPTVLEKTFVAVDTTASALKIANTTYRIGKSIIPKTPDETARAQAIKREITLLQTEADFTSCLVKNTLTPCQGSWFPSACRQQSESFIKIIGPGAHRLVQHEFTSASKRIWDMSDKSKKTESSGMSTKTKVVVGGLAVGGAVGAFWWFGGPAFVIAKLAALKGSVTGIAVGTSAISSSAAMESGAESISTISSIGTGAAIISSEQVARTASAIRTTASVINNVEVIASVVYTSDEERLAQLIIARQTQAPLFDRMKAAHIKDPR